MVNIFNLDLPPVDTSQYNVLDVVRVKTSYNQNCIGTIGKLYINDVFFCDTLEPYDFGFDSNSTLKYIKLHKSIALNNSLKALRYLAIPTGVYDLDLKGYRSSLKKYIPKEYNNCCPLLSGIPGYSGVYIHVGNYPRDTQGCLLVGQLDTSRSQWRLFLSTDTFHKLLKKLWSFKYPIKIRYSRLY